MKHNEKFVINWEKKRQKGKAKYIVSNVLIFSATYCVLNIIINIIKGNGFSNLFSSFDMFITGLIGTLIGLYFGWYIYEERYNKLLRNNYPE